MTDHKATTSVPSAWFAWNRDQGEWKLHIGAEPPAWADGADPLYSHSAIDAARAEERERCAKLCDQAARSYQERGMDMAYAASEWVAAAIRAATQQDHVPEARFGETTPQEPT